MSGIAKCTLPCRRGEIDDPSIFLNEQTYERTEGVSSSSASLHIQDRLMGR